MGKSYIISSVCHCVDVVLVHEGQLILNNSLLSLESLGEIGLSCITTLPNCCDTNRSGNWFPPQGASPIEANSSSTLYQSWNNNQSIQLNRPSGLDSVMDGLYHCEVPDIDDVMHFLYIGIYSSANDGEF